MNRTCKLLTPGYVKQALLKFKHILEQTCYSPSPFSLPIYEKKTQMAHINETDTMSKDQVKLLQQVYGTFLYYTRVVDCTMLRALNDLATRVKDGTQETAKALQCFLDYCAANNDFTVLFRASDVILHNYSDAAYLVATGERLRAGGFTYCCNKTYNKKIINRSISVITNLIKGVMSSSAEAKLPALYMNAREILTLRLTCEEIGHPQPPTPMITDNITASGIINVTFKQDKSKAIDMRFYWLIDRAN